MSTAETRGGHRAYGTSLQTLLVRTQQSIAPRFREVYNQFGLTPVQWRTLRVLWEEDGVQIKDLAERALLDRPVVIGVVDRLERDGLVTRERSEEDRRRVHVRLTDEGHKMEDIAGPMVDEVYADLDQALTDKQWRQLYELLEQVIAHVETESPET